MNLKTVSWNIQVRIKVRLDYGEHRSKLAHFKEQKKNILHFKNSLA